MEDNQLIDSSMICVFNQHYTFVLLLYEFNTKNINQCYTLLLVVQSCAISTGNPRSNGHLRKLKWHCKFNANSWVNCQHLCWTAWFLYTYFSFMLYSLLYLFINMFEIRVPQHATLYPYVDLNFLFQVTLVKMVNEATANIPGWEDER